MGLQCPKGCVGLLGWVAQLVGDPVGGWAGSIGCGAGGSPGAVNSSLVGKTSPEAEQAPWCLSQAQLLTGAGTGSG